MAKNKRIHGVNTLYPCRGVLYPCCGVNTHFYFSKSENIKTDNISLEQSRIFRSNTEGREIELICIFALSVSSHLGLIF